VIRDHRLHYDNVDEAEKSSALFLQAHGDSRGAAGGWIERRLCGFSPTAVNSGQAAAAAWEVGVSGNGGQEWVSFGRGEDDESVSTNTNAAGTQLGEWSAHNLKSGAQELTDILDAAALRKAHMTSHGNEGKQHDDNDEDLVHTGRSHVIEEPCLIPSVSASTHHFKGATPSSATHKSNKRSLQGSESHLVTSDDDLPPPVSLTEVASDSTLEAWDPGRTLLVRAPSSSKKPVAQNGESAQGKEKQAADMPLYLSNSWAAALVFDPIESSPPVTMEAEPDQTWRSQRTHAVYPNDPNYWDKNYPNRPHRYPVAKDGSAEWSRVGSEECRGLANGASSYGSVLDDNDDDDDEKKLDFQTMLSFIDPISSIYGTSGEDLFAATPMLPPAGKRMPRLSSHGSGSSSDLSTKLLDSMLKRSDLDWMVLPALDVCDESQGPDEDAAYEAMLRERSAEIKAELEAEREVVIREGGSYTLTFTAQQCARQVLRDRKRLLQLKRSPNATRAGTTGEEESQLGEVQEVHGEEQGPDDCRKASQRTGGTGTFMSNHLLTSWTHESERKSSPQTKTRESENGSAMGSVNQASLNSPDVSRGRDCSLSHLQQSSSSKSRGGSEQTSAVSGAESAGGARTRPRPIGAQWMPGDK
jgi:hypothetical protein